MNEIACVIAKNPWLVIVGFVLTSVSLFLSVYFYNKQKVRCNLTVYMIERQIFSSTDSGMKECTLSFLDSAVDELNEAKIIISNTGNKRIDFADINNNIPMLIRINDSNSEERGQFIEVFNRSGRIEKKNNVILQEKDNCLFIKFDFLEPRECIEIYVRFMGINTFLSFEGNIKSGRIINKKEKGYSDRRLFDDWRSSEWLQISDIKREKINITVLLLVTILIIAINTGIGRAGIIVAIFLSNVLVTFIMIKLSRIRK